MTKEEAIARIKDHIEVHRCHERNAVKIFEVIEDVQTKRILKICKPEPWKGEQE